MCVRCFKTHSGVVWLGIDIRLMSYDHGRFHEIKRSDSQSPGGDPVDASARESYVNGAFRIASSRLDETFVEKISEALSRLCCVAAVAMAGQIFDREGAKGSDISQYPEL